MTIREYVLNSKTQGINDWLAQIENDKMQKHVATNCKIFANLFKIFEKKFDISKKYIIFV